MCFPEVTLLELQRQFAERLDAALSSHRSSFELLERLTSIKVNDPIRVDSATVVKSYDQRIRRRLTEVGARVLSIPDTPHAVVVDRDLRRRRPFDEKGRGYRDALIWETVLVAAGDRDAAPILFVTHNSADFTNGAGDLHPHLGDDLRQRKIADNRVIVLPSLQVAFERYLQSSLPKASEDVRAELASGQVGSFSVSAWLEKDGPKQLPPFPVNKDDPYDSVKIVVVMESKVLALGDARTTPEGHILFDIQVEATVRLKPENDNLRSDDKAERMLSFLAELGYLLLPTKVEMRLAFVIDKNGGVVSADCLRMIRAGR